MGDGYYIIINKYNNWALTGDEDEYSTWAGFRSYTGTDLQKWQIKQQIEKTGSVTYKYTGQYNKYDLKLTYYGKAPVKIYINNIKVDEWTANHVPGSGVTNPLTSRILKDVYLYPGDEIRVESYIQGEEFICIDKLELISLFPKTVITDQGQLFSLDYDYDPVGNIVRINGDYFDYDGLNRLIWSGNVPTKNDIYGKTYAYGKAWSYDGAGNMIGKQIYQNGQLQQSETLGYDLANQLLYSGTATYTNSIAGERLTKTNANESWIYQYDGESRLRSVRKNNMILAESYYDGAGMRYKKVSNGKTTYYVYSGSNVIMEYNPADGQYKYYIYAGKRSIAEEKGGKKVFYHRDHLGSTRALTDQDRKLVGLSKYDAWGKLESTNVYDEGVINGDFELGSKRWVGNFDNASNEIEAGCGVDGSTGLWFDDNDGSSWGWSNKNLYVSPDTDYQLTGYFKTGSTSAGARVQLRYYDANGTLIKVDDTGSLGASTQWKMFTLNSRAPANAATMEIFLTAEKNQSGVYGKVYFDKIVLKVPGLKGNDSYDYTGKKEDEGTGLKYFGARFYDPEVGRFLTVDPKKDGMNWFVYCRDNPLIMIDPNGLAPVIVIDPGHGGKDTGSKNYTLVEKNINLVVATKVQEILQNKGYEVSMTRTTDKTVSLDLRYGMANSLKADIFVSIHTNSTNPVKNGATIIIPRNHDQKKSLNLAKHIYDQFKTAGVNVQANGIYTDERGLAVLNGTQMPAVIVEIGYIVGDASKLSNEAYLNDIASSISAGIENYFSDNGSEEEI